MPYEMETPPVFRVGFFADYQVLPNLRFFAQGSNILNDYNYENSIDISPAWSSLAIWIKVQLCKKIDN